MSHVSPGDELKKVSEKARSFFVREGVDDLLSGPLGVEIRGHVEVNHSSAVVPEHAEDVHDTEGRGRNRDEIASGDIWHVIVQKRPPSLGWWLSGPDHVLARRLLGHIVPQQRQFGYDSRRAPSGVVSGHAANQLTDFACDEGASRLAWPRFPPPIQLESHAMPLDDRLRLNDGEGRSPVRPDVRQTHPENPVART